MMKVIAGERFNTSEGEMIIPNNQKDHFAVNDRIWLDGYEYYVDAILPPSKPGAKWALKIRKTRVSTNQL